MRTILLTAICFYSLCAGGQPDTASGAKKKVLLDYYYNNEYRPGPGGHPERFHYTWEDESNSGFSLFGSIFRQSGAVPASLETEPTETSLRNAAIYIIVDPDTEKETADPHYISPADAALIDDWVKSGGVLLLMGNDSANAEFQHFNQLAEKFGIHFNQDCKNHVTGNDLETGVINIDRDNPVLSGIKKIYIKDLSTLSIRPPATALLKKNGAVIMATARVGKGTVFAVGDPWLYNEYTNGKNIPAEYENQRAAAALAKWLLQQCSHLPDNEK